MTDYKLTLPQRLDTFKNHNIINSSLDNIPNQKKVTKFLCPELSSSFFLNTKKITVSKRGVEEHRCVNFIFISYF